MNFDVVVGHKICNISPPTGLSSFDGKYIGKKIGEISISGGDTLEYIFADNYDRNVVNEIIKIFKKIPELRGKEPLHYLIQKPKENDHDVHDVVDTISVDNGDPNSNAGSVRESDGKN